MASEYPPWLKAMQNGSIGEARSRAFLLDRFWVLERSVDIEGADFIVQRRITTRNMLDREAPRLGVVQAKYFGTVKTKHHIHKQYVVDANGETRTEFFVLCHAGDEEAPRMFLLTALEISEGFRTIGPPGAEKYEISFDEIVSAKQYEVNNRKLALDRIERQLELAEFTKNRRFIAWALPSATNDLDAILPVYREPINNWWGDIPCGFMEIKKAARESMFTVEEIHEWLRKITEEVDPLKVEELVKRISYYCRDGLGRWSISLSNELDNPDLFSVCRQHKAKVERLKKDGLLDAFLLMSSTICKQISGLLAPMEPLDSKSMFRFAINYDINTLAVRAVTPLSLREAEVQFGNGEGPSRYSPCARLDESVGITFATPGELHCCFSTKMNYVVAGKPATYRDPWYPLYDDCLDEVFSLRYGEL